MEGAVDKVLFTGDFVEGTITEIDDEKRQLRLSIEKHLQALHRYQREIRERAVRDPQLTSSVGRVPIPQRGPAIRQLQGGKGWIKCILLVDDDLPFLNTLRRWLSSSGYEVESTDKGEKGCQLATAKGFDLILMDARLPDMSGMEASRRIGEARPGTVIAIVTGDERAPGIEELAGTNVIGVVSKLGGIAAIEQLIIRVEFEDHASAHIGVFQDIGQEVALMQRVAQAQQGASSLRSVLTTMLNELLASTGAQTGIVFEMDSATKDVSVVAQSGLVPSHSWDVLDLKYSPVRDVIRDGQPILENQALANEQKYSYLLHYLMFEFCIGLRIEGHQKQASRHALFLFHRNSRQFSAIHVQQTLLVSNIMALAIERVEMQSRLLELQSLAVAGLLGSGLVHEVNNHLNAIELSVRNLQADFEDLKRSPQRSSDEAFLKDFNESLTGVATAGENLRKVSSSFLGLLRGGEHTRLDVNEILDQAKQVVEPNAKSYVFIGMWSEKKMPSTWGVPSRLKRAFANVMLNAIQQIKNHSKNGEGTLIVRVAYEPQDKERPIKVRFIDTGPGIHRRDFDRIFEQGVSSRTEGSGLGLHLSRGLIEFMGGRILVEDSLMFIGSCFLIELPAALSAEVMHE